MRGAITVACVAYCKSLVTQHECLQGQAHSRTVISFDERWTRGQHPSKMRILPGFPGRPGIEEEHNIVYITSQAVHHSYNGVRYQAVQACIWVHGAMHHGETCDVL